MILVSGNNRALLELRKIMRFGKTKEGQELIWRRNHSLHNDTGVIVIDDFLYFRRKGKVDEMYITGFDIDDEIDAFNKSDLTELHISAYFSQWQLKDLDFLRKVNHVKGITIDLTDDYIDISGLYSLVDLESMGLYLNQKSAKSVTLSPFRNIKNLGINFFPSNPSDSDLPRLEYIGLMGVKLKSRSFKDFSHINSLKHINVIRSNFETLEGLPRNVERLDFSGCRSLKSLSGIESAKDSLTSLTIEKSRNLTDYSGLSQCKELREIDLSDCGPIQSISFLNEMPKVKEGKFYFYGTDILDNDVSPTIGCNKVGFKDKKQYNYTLEQIRAINSGVDPQSVMDPYQGTPVITIPIFGEIYEKRIEDDNLEESVKIGRRTVDLSIDFSEGVPESWLDRYSSYAEIMPQLMEKIKQSIFDDFHSKGSTYEYLDFHYEEKVSESQVKKFRLKRVSIYPHKEEDYAIWDYVIPILETDYVLAITTDAKGNIRSILMES